MGGQVAPDSVSKIKGQRILHASLLFLEFSQVSFLSNIPKFEDVECFSLILIYENQDC